MLHSSARTRVSQNGRWRPGLLHQKKLDTQHLGDMAQLTDKVRHVERLRAEKGLYCCQNSLF